MEITNKLNLPEPFVRFAERQHHRKSDYSATELIKSPRQVLLKQRHSGNIKKDVSDLVWALFGTAVHKVIEGGEGENELSEGYFLEEIGGKMISGTMDHYTSDGVISDWKTCSVYKILNGDFKDWEQQLNIYAYLAKKAGFDVTGIQVVAIMRDWLRRKAKFDARYPEHQMSVITFNLWTEREQLEFIKQKVSKLIQAENLADEDLPFCTPEERWAKEGLWKVYKNKSAKRAVTGGLYAESAKEKAQEHADKIGGEIRFIEGEPWTACEYCDAVDFCNQTKLKESK